MNSNDNFPSSATYTFKGQVVYLVTFLPNSNKAQSIVNYNEKGALDGPQIHNVLKSSGGYTEEVEKYLNGVLIEQNGVKKNPISSNFKDSLLEGNFRFKSGDSYYEGIAENGTLIRIKQIYDDKYVKDEFIFKKDSFQIKTPGYKEGEFSFKSYALKNTPLLTNSVNNCLMFGNLNGFPYLLIPTGFNLSKLESVLITNYPEKQENIINYKDSLLDGHFQFRFYDFSREGSYEDVKGNAEMGKITSISITKIKYSVYDGIISSKGKTEYIIIGTEITQNEYDLLKSNEIISSKKFTINNPTLLTNSLILGGSLTFYDDEIDYALKIHKDRSARLIDNKVGYAIFSPYSFIVSDFIKLLTK
jgi:hypothetical protein